MAAPLATAIVPDRSFEVDSDGDWICRQAGGTIASPDIYALRLTLIRAQTEDYFLPYYDPKPDHIVVDVGAGIGEEVLSLSDRVARIVAIEAHPLTYRCLSKTVDLSGLRNVETEHCAVSNTAGEVSISTEENHLANSIGSGKGIIVPGYRLDEICARHGIGSIDFLKVNIEGAERLILDGFGDLRIGDLAISCHDFVADETGNDFFRTKAIVRDWLAAKGYEVLERQSDMPWIRDTLYARMK